jgi:hypothetical protein
MPAPPGTKRVKVWPFIDSQANYQITSHFLFLFIHPLYDDY